MSLDDLAGWLRLSKGAFLEQCPEGKLVQTGGWPVGEPQVVELPELDLPDGAEGIIETFVVSDGTATPLGDAEAAAPWVDAVSTMVAVVTTELRAAGVQLADPVYVTASLTPNCDVNGNPHFDDEQVDPDAGMGVVAIVATGAGPRLATEAVPCDVARASLPLQIPDAAPASFEDGSLAVQSWPAGQVVAFPQFAQLHAGPGPSDAPGARRLLVLRAATTPA